MSRTNVAAALALVVALSFAVPALAGSASEVFGRTVGTSILSIGDQDPIHATANTYEPTHAPYTHDRPANDPNQGFAGSSWGHAKRLLATHVIGFPKPPAGAGERVEGGGHDHRDRGQGEQGGLRARRRHVEALTLVFESSG